MFRRDETVTHQAVREAVVNALIHADHGGQGGVVIEKRLDRIEISNPGTLLVAPEQLWRGGVSECRNPILQTMFLLVGGGEKAGSGIDKILQGWQAQHWRHPRVEERQRPDRVVLTPPTVSLLPPEALERLRARFGPAFEALGRDEVLAVVTAEVEGQVSNSRLQQLTDSHPRELTAVLRGLVERGLLVPDGRTVARVYRVGEAPTREALHQAAFRFETVAGSNRADRFEPKVTDASVEDGVIDTSASVTDASTNPSWRRAATTRARILELCRGRFLTTQELASALDREPRNLQRRHVLPLARSGQLELRHPENPRHPDQAYRTSEAE